MHVVQAVLKPNILLYRRPEGWAHRCVLPSKTQLQIPFLRCLQYTGHSEAAGDSAAPQSSLIAPLHDPVTSESLDITSEGTESQREARRFS